MSTDTHGQRSGHPGGHPGGHSGRPAEGGLHRFKDEERRPHRDPRDATDVDLEAINNQYHYTLYAVFRLTRPLPASQPEREQLLGESADFIEAGGVTTRGWYDVGGLRADADSPAPVIRAVRTLCLGCPKPALLWQENEDYVGTLDLLPIGLDHAALADTPAAARWLTAAWLRGEYRPRRRFAHKGDAGRLLLVAGSRGMTGAAVMAAKAALRSGCGLLTAHLPAACCTAYHAAVPEAMTDADAHPDHNTRLARDLPADALLIGCGCGTHPDTAALIADLNSRYHDRAILWDADALNHLARDPALQQHLPPRSVLTPHPGEFARLSGTPLAHDRERIPAAQALAARLNAVIILKGKYSIISAPDGSTAINPTGNAGMAKGGSGDVLAGLTAALLAQGYPPFTAACLGTYLHGLAADLALKKSAINSLTASDIISAIPAAWRNIAAEPA